VERAGSLATASHCPGTASPCLLISSPPPCRGKCGTEHVERPDSATPPPSRPGSCFSFNTCRRRIFASPTIFFHYLPLRTGVAVPSSQPLVVNLCFGEGTVLSTWLKWQWTRPMVRPHTHRRGHPRPPVHRRLGLLGLPSMRHIFQMLIVSQMRSPSPSPGSVLDRAARRPRSTAPQRRPTSSTALPSPQTCILHNGCPATPANPESFPTDPPR
jgi:hypothetical protein